MVCSGESGHKYQILHNDKTPSVAVLGIVFSLSSLFRKQLVYHFHIILKTITNFMTLQFHKGWSFVRLFTKQMGFHSVIVTKFLVTYVNIIAKVHKIVFWPYLETFELSF